MIKKMINTTLAVAGMALAAILIVESAGALAVFADEDTVPANTFTSGTTSLTTSPTSVLVTFANMPPGDTVTKPLVVRNNGTESLRYAVASAATNADTPTPKGLKDQLVLTVKTIDATTPATPCNEFDGTLELYSGDLDGAAGKILGDNAVGQDGVATTGGDRTLAASANETLCFRVNLPLATDNTFQGAATTATFTLDSEQTKHN